MGEWELCLGCTGRLTPRAMRGPWNSPLNSQPLKKAATSSFAALSRKRLRSTAPTANSYPHRPLVATLPIRCKASHEQHFGIRTVIPPFLVGARSRVKRPWPAAVLGVMPARDFLYLWNATEKGFVNRLGGVVVREFEASPYPISRDVFEVSDGGLRAIGEFPR